MKPFINRIALVLVLFVMTIPAHGDIPSPNKKQPKKTETAKVRMHVFGDNEMSEATLKIPRDLLTQLKAEADGNGSLNASTNRWSLTKTQTVFIGLCMSLSLIFGGVWFVRSRSSINSNGSSRKFIALAFLTLLAATTTSVYANIGPPIYARTLTTKILDPGVVSRGAFGDVKVVVGEDGSDIYLILPKPKEEKK